MTLQMIISTIGLSSIILSIINIVAMHFQKRKCLNLREEQRRLNIAIRQYYQICS